ncbi:MAG: tetratricopeptide repeat protein [Opitutae bacterium]
MFRNIIYLLPLLFLNQVICANEGVRLISADLPAITEAADSGDAYAQGFLALCHFHGDKGLFVSNLEARFYAENSASRGHWLGNFVLGCLSRYKPLGPDPTQVAKYLLKSFRDPDGKLIKQAAIGDPIAIYVLAEIFVAEEIQTILRPDMKMAADYYQISAASGYAPAGVQSALIKLYGLADSFSDTLAVQKEGIALLQKGTDQKLPAAHHYLGRCFLEGLGLKADKELALVHFLAAAEKGYGAAQLMVADFYAYGLTGEPKEDLAFKYIERAVEIHEEGAEKKLDEYKRHFGHIKDLPDPSSSTDPSKGQPQAKSTPDPNIARLPDETIPPPPSKTIRLPSAYAKDERAQPQVVKSPQKMIGAKQQVTEVTQSSITQIRENAKKIYWGQSSNASMSDAFQSFEKCANMGDGESARYLGIMYLRGKGVKKNANEAIKWLEIAAGKGDELAAKNLVSLRKIMKL